MFQRTIFLLFFVATIFSCGNNKTESDSQTKDTAVVTLGGTEILPNKFDTTTLFISVEDHFKEDQIAAWANKKFMAFIQDTLTKKFSLISAIPNKHSFAETQNRRHLFSNWMEVDEDGNVGYMVDIELPKNSKCIYLIDNPYMKSPKMNIENKVTWGQIIEPNKNISWNQGSEKHSLLASATFENNTGKTINYKEYGLTYVIENQGKKTMNIPLNFIPWFDDAYVKILFIGDLDGDNLNDIIIDNNYKYTNENISGVLFSSKASGNGTPKAISKQDWGWLKDAVFHIEGC